MNSWFGNSGIVSDKFAQEHPYAALGINSIGDGLLGYGVAKGYRTANNAYNKNKLYTALYKDAVDFNGSIRGSRLIPEGKPFMSEFDFGKESGYAVHMDKGDHLGAFTGQGAYIEDGMLYPG